MNRLDLISIVVPIYNIDVYFERCILSIVAQTYKNIEIILIDDGSTDQSGVLCDLSMFKDRRIYVIHKLNGGLSDARNLGIKISKGKHIMFVDGDDYISPTMAEILKKSIGNNNAQIGICSFVCVDECGNILEKRMDGLIRSNYTTSGHEALLKLSTMGSVLSISCNKLFDIKLFDTIHYPVGKIHEDEFVIHHLLAKSNKVTFVSDECYYYVQRDGSIIHSKSAKSSLDSIEAKIDRAILMEKKGIYSTSKELFISSVFMFLDVFSKNQDKNLEEGYNYILNQIRKNYRLVRKGNIIEKMTVASVCISPKIFISYSKFRKNIDRL